MGAGQQQQQQGPFDLMYFLKGALAGGICVRLISYILVRCNPWPSYSCRCGQDQNSIGSLHLLQGNGQCV
jgi:hypothetical protein